MEVHSFPFWSDWWGSRSWPWSISLCPLALNFSDLLLKEFGFGMVKEILARSRFCFHHHSASYVWTKHFKLAWDFFQLIYLAAFLSIWRIIHLAQAFINIIKRVFEIQLQTFILRKWHYLFDMSLVLFEQKTQIIDVFVLGSI